MSYMLGVYFVTGGLIVVGLVPVTTGSDYVATRVGENQTISLNVSQAGGEFRVGVEVNNLTEYLFFKFHDTDIKRRNNSSTLYGDRYRVRGNITSSVFSLTLYNVTPEDAGIYKCWKFDTQRVPGCEQLLIVAQNPSQPNITGPASAVSGENVTLTCSSSSRSLPPDHPPLTMTYKWRRNSEEIEGGGDVSVDGPNLTVRNTSREKEGNYTCQAVEERLMSDWSARYVLDVQYGPNTVQFNEHDHKVTATEGDPLTVTCSADCNPACTVTWRDTFGQKVTSGPRGAVLSIPAVNRSLSDLYTCHVNNTHGNKSRNLKLDIQYPPSVKNFSDISINNFTRKVDSVSFLCVVDGNPKPSVYLRYDLTNRTYPMTCETLSKSIYTSHQHYECTHTIENFDVFLHGAYSCRAENTVGHVDSRAVVVTVPTAEPGVSNVVSTAVICSVLVAVVLAILLYRHKAKKGKRPYRVGADKEDQLQQDPSHLYSKVNKRKRAGHEVYEPVKLDSPRQFMNRMYGARPSSERMVLINNSDHNPGVTNNCGKRNEDGLIYADLDLVQPTLVDGMPIIHSREEPVVYEEIDFFLTPGPQLPDKIWKVEEDDECW